MTIDIKTGRPIFYECPECKKSTRGLVNGHCHECEEMERTRQRMWADMKAGKFSFGDIT